MQVSSSENFRANLRSIMALRGISQRDFASRIGMSYPYVNKVLQGIYSPPLKTCEHMAETLGMTVSEMILEPKKFNRQHRVIA
jgi:transcriptional regulator with XRE-family HTH domain